MHTYKEYKSSWERAPEIMASSPASLHFRHSIAGMEMI